MIRLVSPTEIDRMAPVFLAGLNRAFGEWGDAAQFDWAFRRAGDDPPAEIFVAEEAGEPIAGIALVYRHIARGDGTPRLMGCLSGAWSLPERLRKGLFGDLCAAATSRTLERGGAAAIAFIAAGRASAATVKRMSLSNAEGAVFEVGPEWAWVARETLAPIDPESATVACLEKRRQADVVGIVHDAASWHRQMLARPRPVSAFRLPDGTVAVVEQGVSTACLLDLSTADPDRTVRAVRALACQAWESGLSLSVNTFDPALIAALSGLGLVPRTHRLFVLAGEPGFAEASEWRISNGDRM